ncbi:MAG: hypothetical protein ACFFD1_09925 [Candidatus Thorarchaeota archaeon]
MDDELNLDSGRKVILDNKYGTVWFYPEKKIVHHQFHMFCYGENFRNILNTDAELIEKYGCKKLLSDDRKLSTIAKDDEKWSHDWYLRIKKAGWRIWAMVRPENVIGKLGSKRRINREQDFDINFKTFAEQKDAFEWLEKQ